MSELHTASFEAKIRRVTQMPEPSQAFVAALWEKLDQAPRPSPPVITRQPWYRRPAWVALAVLLVLIAALFIGFGPRNVSAFIRQFLGFEDSGLRAVQEAGLVTDLDMTAKPTLVPDESALTNTPPAASMLSISQTLEGITLTLDWAYVDESRLALSWTTDPLPGELTYATPTLTFEGFTPAAKDGSLQSLRGENNQLLFVTYQVIQADIVGDTINFAVDLPLVQLKDYDGEPVANFHFELQDIPVFRGQTVQLQQTYAHEVNGVEIRLESIRMTPSFTEVRVCYDFPTEDAPFWYMAHATLQIGDGPQESYRGYQYLSEIEDDHCVELGFGGGSVAEADQLIFRVLDLSVPVTMLDELPAERIDAANEILAERGIEIAPAPAAESEGPGGWVFVQNPGHTMQPEDDPTLLVIQALTETMSGPWTFYVDLPQPEDFAVPDEGQVAKPTPIVIDSQTQAGITVTLDWVYVDEGRMTIALTTDPIPQGFVFGLPNVNIAGIDDFHEARINQSSTSALIEIYRVVQVDVVGEVIDFSIDLPLINQDESEEKPLATYHFELLDIPVYRGSSIPLTQTTSVTLDGVEVQLKSVRVMPSVTELEVCYDFPPGDESSWYMPQPSLQIDDGPEETGYAFHYLGENEGKHCAKIEFMLGNAGGGEQLIFRVNTLFVPLPNELPDEKIYAANETLAEYGLEIAPAEGDYSDGPGGWVFAQTPQWELYSEDPRWLVINALREKMTGPWTFYVDLPSDDEYSGIDGTHTSDPTPTVIDSQTQAGITVTLDWVYVDTLRAGVGYTITGLPDEPEATELYGMVYLLDAEGSPISGPGMRSSSIARVENQPGVLQGTYSVDFMAPLTQPEAQFQWVITLDGTRRNEIIAEFPLPPDAPIYPAGVFPPQLPEGFIGTYTFDFTAPVHPMTVREDIPSVTANGLEILAPRAEISPSMSKVMLCYEKPSDRDWWITQGTIGDGKEETHFGRSTLIFDKVISAYENIPERTASWEIPPQIERAELGRCVVLNFPLGYGDAHRDLILTIPYLEISPPEVIPEAELAAAREILRAQGIEITYETWQSGSGGGVTFTTLPEGMSQETAHHKYMEALGYIYAGPWEIIIEN